jgi:hypothetical protein
MQGSLTDPSYTPRFKPPSPWVRVPLALILAAGLVVGGVYMAAHGTTLNDQAHALAQANAGDVLLTAVDPVRGEWAVARVAAREVAFQEDTGCEVIQEEMLTGNNIAVTQMRAQSYIDLSLSGTTADVRAEYGEGYWIVPGVKQSSGTSYRFLPDRYVALVVVIHCAAPEPTTAPGIGT